MATMVSHIGLSNQDATLLKSMFNLLTTSSKIVDVTFDKEYREDGSFDIVFVNSDVDEAVYAWERLSRNNKLLTPIMVTSGATYHEYKYVLKRPLVLNRIISVFEEVTKTTSKNKKNLTGRLKLLVVDDSFSVRKYMEYTLPGLTTAPLLIEFAASGDEALQRMQNSSYDLVFLDVIMPGVDGYKICKKIKSSYRSYVVMLTSKKSPFDKVRGTMSGCNAYITKPPPGEKIKAVLDKCLALHSTSVNRLAIQRKAVGS